MPASLLLLLACSDGELGLKEDPLDTSVEDSALDTSIQDTGPDTGGEDTGGPAGDLVLLSLNLQCFKLDDTAHGSNAERWTAIAGQVAQDGVHAMAVQEACERDGESAIEDLAAALELGTGEPWSTAWTSTHLAWEGSDDEADEGVGLLVRGDHALEAAVLEYSVQGTLMRRAISVTLPSELGGLRLSGVHLDQEDPDARRMQARQQAVDALVARPDRGALLVGDFNAVVGSDALDDLAAAGFDQLSAEADAGELIDHAFAPQGSGVASTSARTVFTGDDAVSDHPGLLVVLELSEPSGTTPTRLVAEVDAGWGHHLSVRGDTAPLDWELGWPAVNTGDSRWEVAFSDWSGTYKWLLDDATWESGGDRSAEAGDEDVGTPSF